MTIIAVVALILTSLALLASTVIRIRGPIDAALLVPAGWLATMPFQALLLASGLQFQGAPQANLYLAISMANLTLLGFQLFVSRGGVKWLGGVVPWLTATATHPSSDPRRLRYWYWALLVLAVSLAILHWALMPSIPLVDLLRGNASDQQIAIARENSAKLLAVPALLKYVFTWNSRILLPILLTTAVVARWRWTAVFVAIFGLAYIASPLEKLPSFLFMLGPVLAIAIRDHKKAWAPTVIVGAVLAALPAYAIAQGIVFETSRYTAAHPTTSTAAVQASPPPTSSPISPGSQFRNLPGPLPGIFDLVVRRMGEGPIDVSYEWFAFFPSQHAYLDGSGWEPWKVLSPGYQTPANMVGQWAYYGKQGYDLPSISAYGSFIADGWAEFGYFGVLAACLVLFAFCALLELFRSVTDRPFILGCYAPALVLLATTPPQAGLPAMMFSLGLALVPVICFAYLQSERLTTSGRLRLAQHTAA